MGKTRTLHLHQGRLGMRSQKAPVSTLNLVPALAALNKSTHYECEIRSRCEKDLYRRLSASQKNFLALLPKTFMASLEHKFEITNFDTKQNLLHSTVH